MEAMLIGNSLRKCYEGIRRLGVVAERRFGVTVRFLMMEYTREGLGTDDSDPEEREK